MVNIHVPSGKFITSVYTLYIGMYSLDHRYSCASGLHVGIVFVVDVVVVVHLSTKHHIQTRFIVTLIFLSA